MVPSSDYPSSDCPARLHEGPFPPELGGLVALESVDVSSNRLTGECDSFVLRLLSAVSSLCYRIATRARNSLLISWPACNQEKRRSKGGIERYSTGSRYRREVRVVHMFHF